MSDIQGLWVVQYVGLNGDDAGVITFVDGKVLGGDNAFIYVGKYRHIGNQITAQITVTNFNPRISSVFGIPANEYAIKANLVQQPDGTLQGNASMIQPEGVGILVKLTKYAELS